MFISEAFGTDATANSISGIVAPFANFIPLILIALVFYFFIIRPHHKKLRELKKMIDQVKRGDTVATSNGIVGTVNKIDESNAQFLIEIAPKVEIKVLKSAISEVLNKEIQDKQNQKNKTEKDDKKNKNYLDKNKK